MVSDQAKNQMKQSLDSMYQTLAGSDDSRDREAAHAIKTAAKFLGQSLAHNPQGKTEGQRQADLAQQDSSNRRGMGSVLTETYG